MNMKMNRRYGVAVPLLVLLFALGMTTNADAGASTAVDIAKAVTWRISQSRDWQGEIAALAQTSVSDVQANVQTNLQVDAADAPIRDLKLRREFRFEQGKVYEKVQRVFEFRSAASLDKYGTYVIDLDPTSELITFTGVAVLAPDGSTTTFDSRTIQFQDTDSYHLFVDEYDLVLPLPNLEVGSVAMVEYEKVVNLAQRHTPWMTIFSPQSSRPRALLEVSVSWEAGAKPVWHNPFEPLVCNEGASQLACRATNLPAVYLEDRVRFADQLDYFSIAQPMSWDEVVELARVGFDSALKNDAGVSELYEKLTKDTEQEEDVLRVFFEFVSRKIRYVSASEGKNGITPHDVGQTLKQRYGDCKDKSTLLVALLNRAGIHAYPVLVATERLAVEPLVLPTMGYFDHMIVCGEMASTGAFCVDPTDMWTASDSLSEWVQGAASLPLLPDARPQRLPSDEHTWTVVLDTELEFFTDGRQVERQSRRFVGPYAAWVRAILSEKTNKERQRWALERYQQVVSDKAEPTFSFSGLAGQDSALTIRSEASYTNIFDAEEALNYTEALAWLIDLVGDFGNSNEVFGYEFSGIRVDSEMRIVVPDKWAFEQRGADVSLVGDYGEFHQTLTRASADARQELKVSTQLRMPRRSIEQAQLESFNRFMQLVKEQSKAYFRAPLANP